MSTILAEAGEDCTQHRARSKTLCITSRNLCSPSSCWRPDETLRGGEFSPPNGSSAPVSSSTHDSQQRRGRPGQHIRFRGYLAGANKRQGLTLQRYMRCGGLD